MRRYYDPRTPADRIKGTGIMLEPQRHHMDELYSKLNLAGLTNRINEIQQRLIRLAAAKTYSQSPTQHDTFASTIDEVRRNHLASILT